MPAIITHNYFGQCVLSQIREFDVDPDARQAFLLGNQGPDPLFYAVTSLATCMHATLGQQMHRLDPARIISELARASLDAPLAHRDIIRAYAAGFVCHYILDSYVHPLLVFQQRSYCAAGIPGLSKADESDVHIFMERDIDEVVLFTTLGETVASFDPPTRILSVDDWVLQAISGAFSKAVWNSMGVRIPKGHFARCVRRFRLVERIFHSPTGEWRERLGGIESKFRRFSFCRNSMLRPLEVESSPFMNPDHEVWVDPFSGEERNESFNDLYADALADALSWIPRLFGDSAASVEMVRQMTGGFDFSGNQAY